MLLRGKPSINGPFSMAMLNNQRVNHIKSILVENFVLWDYVSHIQYHDVGNNKSFFINPTFLVLRRAVPREHAGHWWSSSQNFRGWKVRSTLARGCDPFLFLLFLLLFMTWYDLSEKKRYPLVLQVIDWLSSSSPKLRTESCRMGSPPFWLHPVLESKAIPSF